MIELIIFQCLFICQFSFNSRHLSDTITFYCPLEHNSNDSFLIKIEKVNEMNKIIKKKHLQKYKHLSQI